MELRSRLRPMLTPRAGLRLSFSWGRFSKAQISRPVKYMPRELLGSCGKLQCSTRRLRQGNLTLRPVERDHPVGSRRCERREVRLTYPLAASQSEPFRTAGAPSRRRSMTGSTTGRHRGHGIHAVVLGAAGRAGNPMPGRTSGEDPSERNPEAEARSEG